MDNRHILSCLVQNHSGVLTRISGLFSRRGYNIESLTVCATEHKDLSRMTIVVIGDEYIKEQITKQLDKLYSVKKVLTLENNLAIERELLLIKICLNDNIELIKKIKQKYNAKTIENKNDYEAIELTDTPIQIDKFINELSKFKIIELARTGSTALLKQGNNKINI